MVVKEVIPGSIADEIGIDTGDIIVSINGNKLEDIIDYWFGISTESVALEIKTDEEIWEAEIEKNIDEDLGIIFENDLDKIKSCKNNCIFCFVNQLPKGLRRSLYFKDDDYRLSFLSGSYITLSNLNGGEFERIVTQKLSPIYISVHTTDDELRKKIIGYNYNKKILEQIKYLVENGIKVNTQIVLCSGINDGEILCKSIEDLYELYPGVQSLAVVPVGLTRFREGKPVLTNITEENAKETLRKIHKYQTRFLSQIGSRFVWGSDELYIKGNMPIPPPPFYEEFIQLENGVGMVAKFTNEAAEALDNINVVKKSSKKVAIATGVDFYPFMKRITAEAHLKTGIEINMYSVENIFFGGGVTVTGLLTGSDYINALKGKLYEDVLLISETCIKNGSDIFLDDISVRELSAELNIDCQIVKDNGYDLINSIISY